MPNWMDYLTEPLVPEAPVRRLQEQIDAPTLERSPWEARLRGFGAGALEGLRGLTSPLSLASMLPVGRAASMAPRAIQALSKTIPGVPPRLMAAERAFDVVDDLPISQVLPNMGAGDDMVGALRYGLAKAPHGRPVLKTFDDLDSQILTSRFQDAMTPNLPTVPTYPTFPSSPPTYMRPFGGPKPGTWPAADMTRSAGTTGHWEEGLGGLADLANLRGTRRF